MAKFRTKGAFMEKAYRQLVRLDPAREEEHEAENKQLLTQLSCVLDYCTKAMWAQKKSAPSAAR